MIILQLIMYIQLILSIWWSIYSADWKNIKTESNNKVKSKADRYKGENHEFQLSGLFNLSTLGIFRHMNCSWEKDTVYYTELNPIDRCGRGYSELL